MHEHPWYLRGGSILPEAKSTWGVWSILGLGWRGGVPPCLGKTRGEVGYPPLGSFLSQNVFCFKLDAKSIPEALT